ncbi:MAG: putative quinol monooxygenase [Microbacterium sp.]
MAFVCSATWIAKPGEIETVVAALARLSEASREERGNLYYQVYQRAEEPTVFRIFEVYADEAAFSAHTSSQHFKQWATGMAIPALQTRKRDFYETLIF